MSDSAATSEVIAQVTGYRHVIKEQPKASRTDLANTEIMLKET